MKVRAERWRQNPAKDAERAAQLAPYVNAVKRTASRRSGEGAHATAAEAFRWLVEEFRVSLFAQELGTAVPVSPVKLEGRREGIGCACAKGGSSGSGTHGREGGEQKERRGGEEFWGARFAVSSVISGAKHID
jgi:ATP-dependent helicase HrpA